MTMRLMAIAVAALVLSSCAGVIDRCGFGLPDGKPGAPLPR